jgi:hypothetical protein
MVFKIFSRLHIALQEVNGFSRSNSAIGPRGQSFWAARTSVHLPGCLSCQQHANAISRRPEASAPVHGTLRWVPFGSDGAEVLDE